MAGWARTASERGLISFAGGLAALTLCLLFLRTGAGQNWERQTLDVRFNQRGARTTTAPIVIIVVDDATEQKWSEPTLFWGAHYARVLQAAQNAGAETIALDAVPAVDVDAYLDELGVPENIRPDTDLARALLDGQGKIVLASLLHVGGTPRLPVARFATIPDVAENIGFADLLPDPDGIIRAMPYSAADNRDRHDGMVRPAFAALAAARFRHGDISGSRKAASLFSNTTLADDGLWTRFGVNYSGRSFPTLPAWKVEQNALTPAERASLKGALVFVGVTAATGNDRYRTPFPGTTEGVMLHAEAAATLLDGCSLRGLTSGQNGWLCACVGLMVLLAGGFLPGRGGLPFAFLATFLAGAGSQMAFAHSNSVLPLGGLLLCALVPCGIQQAIVAIEERLRRLQLRGLLGRQISPQVRDYLLQSPDSLRMNRMECDAVILFFDIRGSLPFAESRTPGETLHELNALFARVVPLLEQHHGLLFRYTGDGFLAVFGAPAPLPNAPDCALRAAIGMVDAVAADNTRRAAQNKPSLLVGCGLHSGPVVCGNLGVAERSDFTVIGDVVNRAARLEGCNKTLHSEIVVSRTVWEQLPDPKPAHFVGPVEVAIEGSGRGEEVFYREAIYHKPVV